MNKLIGCSALVAAMWLCFGVSAEAASARGGAKPMKVVSVSTTQTPVSEGPTTVYSIMLGTGAVTDYVVLVDSANATAWAVASQSTANGFRGRFYPGSATVNSNLVFDPPLLFANGLTMINSTVLMTAGVVYEPGIAQ